MPEQQPGEVEDRNLRDRHELMAELVTHLREKRSGCGSNGWTGSAMRTCSRR